MNRLRAASISVFGTFLFLAAACGAPTATPTPTPRSTPAPIPTYIVIEVTPSPLFSADDPVTAVAPDLNHVLWNLDRFESFNIAGTYSVTDPSEFGGKTTRFTINGGISSTFRMQPIPGVLTLGMSPEPPSFELNFRPVDGSPKDATEAGIRAAYGRVAENSTSVEFKTYASHSEYLHDPYKDLDKLPNLPVFMSLALSGGRDAQFTVFEWVRFRPGDVQIVERIGEEGRDTWVLEGNLARANGDEETWRVWVDAEGRVRRIRINSVNPADSTADRLAVNITFSDFGHFYPFDGFGGVRPVPPLSVTRTRWVTPTPVKYQAENPTPNPRGPSR